MYSFFGDDKSEYKKVKEVNKNIEKVTMNIKMFCWTGNVSGNQ